MSTPVHNMMASYYRGVGDLYHAQASLFDDTGKLWTDWFEAQRESFFNFSQQMADNCLKAATTIKQHTEQHQREFQQQQHRAAAQ